MGGKVREKRRNCGTGSSGSKKEKGWVVGNCGEIRGGEVGELKGNKG